MKHYKLLLLVPFVLLTGCEMEKEITVEDAKKTVELIQNSVIEDPYMFVLTNKGDIGKGEEKISIDLSYKYKKSSNGYYSYIKGLNGNESYDAEMYCVKDYTYGEVKYVKYFDASKNDYVKAVATLKDDENYETAFDNLGVYRTESVLNYYLGVRMFSEQVDEGDTLKIYSSREGQLTLQYVTNVKNADSTEDEIVSKGKSVYKYENYRFSAVNVDTSSNYGNKWVTKGAMEYDDKIKVELPSDWENYIPRAAD